MGLLVFILEEKIGKNLNSFKMVINGIGGLIYNRIDYRKLMVFYKIQWFVILYLVIILFYVLRIYVEFGYQVVISMEYVLFF